MQWISISYLLVMNLIGFLSMVIDKRRARRKQWRTPERTLFLIALLGGSIGSIAGMYTVRHKTQHKTFIYGMPAILFLQVGCAIYLFIMK